MEMVAIETTVLLPPRLNPSPATTMIAVMQTTNDGIPSLDRLIPE